MSHWTVKADLPTLLVKGDVVVSKKYHSEDSSAAAGYLEGC